ncbi:MAG: hypothetical protein JWM95_4164 [Gemmatimonadetes bacterium]|nr:hypothetical protein [Gemmatimonadota bacterium]
MSGPLLFLGTTREHYMLLFGAAGAIGLVAGTVGAWIGAYLGARRAVRTAQLNAPLERVSMAQLEPVLLALDTIALEVERISEAQRFQTRMLTERPQMPLPRIEPRNITPH